MTEIMCPRCTQSRARKIEAERDAGRTWGEIARTVYVNPGTANRYYRVLKRYGIEAFRRD